MTAAKEDRMQHYTHRVEVDDDFIELHVSMEPVELMWEWRIYERFTDAKAHRFKTFEAAKKAGLYAVMDRIEQRKNEWAREFDAIEGEILDAK